MYRHFHLLFIAICACCAQDLKFPDDFKFGTATSAYQVEGAWNVSDKGLNIWDDDTHTKPWFVSDLSNGDVACDSYHLYKRDVEMLKELGVDFYRFSLSWSRILPTGFTNEISADGIRYYNDLIDELLANGIEPYVTIYHWDLPQPLQLLGGWTNPSMADYFVDFARIVFKNYADRVKMWFTFNEPLVFCSRGYGSGLFSPLVESPALGEYLCSYTVMVAHGKTYRMYEKEFKNEYPAKIGLVDVCHKAVAPTPEEEYLAEIYMDFSCHMHIDPLFTGDFPSNMRQLVGEKSLEQGFSKSRLPEFTGEEIKIIKGSADFVAINQYGSRSIRKLLPEDGVSVPSLYDDAGVTMASVEMDRTDAAAMRWTLVHLKERYNDPEILITENGLPETGNDIVDDSRVNYIKNYMNAVLEALILDKARVTAYTFWSLMDNFEWVDGYGTKYGLYQVDFDSPSRTRTPKKSAFVFQEIIRSKTVDFTYEP